MKTVLAIIATLVMSFCLTYAQDNPSRTSNDPNRTEAAPVARTYDTTNEHRTDWGWIGLLGLAGLGGLAGRKRNDHMSNRETTNVRRVA